MGRIIVWENVSIDGVIEDPRGDESLGCGDGCSYRRQTDQAKWTEVLLADALTVDALQLGRRTYESTVSPARPWRSGCARRSRTCTSSTRASGCSRHGGMPYWWNRSGFALSASRRSNTT